LVARLVETRPMAARANPCHPPSSAPCAERKSGCPGDDGGAGGFRGKRMASLLSRATEIGCPASGPRERPLCWLLLRCPLLPLFALSCCCSSQQKSRQRSPSIRQCTPTTFGCAFLPRINGRWAGKHFSTRICRGCDGEREVSSCASSACWSVTASFPRRALLSSLELGISIFHRSPLPRRRRHQTHPHRIPTILSSQLKEATRFRVPPLPSSPSSSNLSLSSEFFAFRHIRHHSSAATYATWRSLPFSTAPTPLWLPLG